MKYVLDSSVALKFVLPEVDSGKAIRLRDDYRKSIHNLISPDIFTSEVANGLVSAERSARITWHRTVRRCEAPDAPGGPLQRVSRVTWVADIGWEHWRAAEPSDPRLRTG